MTTIFRNPRTKQTATEKYFAALGLTARQSWARKAWRDRRTEEVYSELVTTLNTPQLLKHFSAQGLRCVGERPTWGGRKYLFVQNNEQGEFLGNVLLTRYSGAGFGVSVFNGVANNSSF